MPADLPALLAYFSSLIPHVDTCILISFLFLLLLRQARHTPCDKKEGTLPSLDILFKYILFRRQLPRQPRLIIPCGGGITGRHCITCRKCLLLPVCQRALWFYPLPGYFPVSSPFTDSSDGFKQICYIRSGLTEKSGITFRISSISAVYF